MRPNGFGAAFQYTLLHSLHVDFYEVAVAQAEAVDFAKWNRIGREARVVAGEVHAAKVALSFIVRLRNAHHAIGIADCGLVAKDVIQIVEHYISAQAVVKNALRLEGQHPPATAGELGQRHGVSADVGANVKYCVAWLDDLAKEDDFPFGKLAVELQRS